MTDAIEAKPEEKKNPLLAARDKVRGFFGGLFTPTPPPPVEYQVVRWDGENVGMDITRLGGQGAMMSSLAKDGWRFLAVLPNGGMLMGRNHKSVVQVDGEVQIYHRNDSTSYPYYARERKCCDHEPKRTPHPDDGERTIHIPEDGDGQFSAPEKKPDPFQGVKSMVKDIRTEIKTALEETDD
jgi:hypothetical protein